MMIMIYERASPTETIVYNLTARYVLFCPQWRPARPLSTGSPIVSTCTLGGGQGWDHYGGDDADNGDGDGDGDGDDDDDGGDA